MLIEYLPPVVKKIREMQAICAAEQPYFYEAEQEIENILCRAFISLADEKGISRFETIYGITPTEYKTLEERRIAILIRSSKKNLSLNDVTNLFCNYSQEIALVPNYNTDELTVEVSDNVADIGIIYKILDDLISIIVYIYFAMEIITKVKFVETKKVLELETTNKLKDSEISCSLFLVTLIKTETFEDTTVTMQKDLWFLDGSVLLNGSKKLNAIQIEEVL